MKKLQTSSPRRSARWTPSSSPPSRRRPLRLAPGIHPRGAQGGEGGSRRETRRGTRREEASDAFNKKQLGIAVDARKEADKKLEDTSRTRKTAAAEKAKLDKQMAEDAKRHEKETSDLEKALAAEKSAHPVTDEKATAVEAAKNAITEELAMLKSSSAKKEAEFTADAIKAVDELKKMRSAARPPLPHPPRRSRG